MQISSKLFNQQSVRNFEKLAEGIQSTQEKISTGQNILSASDDPVAAVNLSVAKEQRDLLSRFQANATAATSRLNLSDAVLDQSITTLTRIMELTVQAGNGTGETTAILQEIDAMKEVMVEMANTKDAQGQSLFSGYKTNSVPFEIQLDGSVKYKGDRGQHSVSLSESMKVQTGIDGGSGFMRIKTSDGTHGVFDIIDNSFNAVKTSNTYNRQASANAHAEVSFTLPPNPQKWTFNLKGSQGQTSITAELANGKLDDTLLPIINALTDKTGITASLNATTGAVVLKDGFNGEIIMSDVEIAGNEFGSGDVRYFAELNSYDGLGGVVGAPRRLTDSDQLVSSATNYLKNALDHLSDQRAFIGAQQNKVTQQEAVLQERQFIVSDKISDLGDADLASLVTRLQTMLVNRDASHAAFAKIGQQNLFDYLR